MAEKTLEQVYSEADSSYQQTTVIPRWMPDDGEYAVAITEVVENVQRNKKTQLDELVVYVIGTIIDGDNQGRRFVVVRSGSASRMSLKSLAELVLGQSESIKSDVEGIKALAAAGTGLLLSVAVVRSNDNQGRTWANANINDIIEGGVSADATPEPDDA